METISNLGPIFKLSINSLFMSVWPIWAFSFINIMATYYGTTEAAAQYQMRTLGIMSIVLPECFNFTSQILSGNALGEFKPNKAKKIYKVCMFLASILTLIWIVVLLFARDSITHMFTDMAQVIDLMDDAWINFLIFLFFECTLVLSTSLIKAAGRQFYGAIVNGTGYMLLGVPISYYCAFVKEMGVSGFWIGPMIAAIFGTIVLNIILCTMDWPKLIEEIKEREEKENELRK